VRAFQTGVVHAMHDCTEGGVLGALYEMATASGLGLEVSERDVPVSRETKRICSALGVDALKLISSGTLMVAVAKGKEALVREAVGAAGSSIAPIGRFTKGKVVLTRDGSAVELKGPPADEIWRLHEQSGDTLWG
jgi:hydrogenase expression/formation protein HypE